MFGYIKRSYQTHQMIKAFENEQFKDVFSDAGVTCTRFGNMTVKQVADKSAAVQQAIKALKAAYREQLKTENAQSIPQRAIHGCFLSFLNKALPLYQGTLSLPNRVATTADQMKSHCAIVRAFKQWRDPNWWTSTEKEPKEEEPRVIDYYKLYPRPYARLFSYIKDYRPTWVYNRDQTLQAYNPLPSAEKRSQATLVSSDFDANFLPKSTLGAHQNKVCKTVARVFLETINKIEGNHHLAGLLPPKTFELYSSWRHHPNLTIDTVAAAIKDGTICLKSPEVLALFELLIFEYYRLSQNGPLNDMENKAYLEAVRLISIAQAYID